MIPMNRRTITRLCVALGCLCLAACGDPEQKFLLKVTTEDGKPAVGAACNAWFTRNGESGSMRNRFVTGRTDSEGIVELQGETLWYQSGVRAEMSGCYPAEAHQLWITGKSGNRWQPWPVEVELVMRKIRNPHPMHALACGTSLRFKFPGNKMGPFGFDLLARDWVAPHGAGKVADLVMEGVLRDPGDRSLNPEGWVRVTFSNEGDGIQPDSQSRHAGGSLMVGSYEAPEDGYLRQWMFSNFLPESESDRARDNPVPGAPRLILRLRSEMKEGKVERALYGKMHAGMYPLLSPNIVGFRATYYLNAEPNDRNLEWDMKTNLFADLPRERWPKQP